MNNMLPKSFYIEETMASTDAEKNPELGAGVSRSADQCRIFHPKKGPRPAEFFSVRRRP